jgi:hypothetical protein
MAFSDHARHDIVLTPWENSWQNGY